MITQSFSVDRDELSGAISLLGIVKFNRYGTLCNTQQLTQPPLARSVPLSWFTSRVGGGSAFFVRRQHDIMKKLVFTLIVTMLALRSFPGPIPPPNFSAISYSQANGVSVTIKGASTKYPLAIQMSTDLTNTNWIWLQTNSHPASIYTFINLPATNTCEYFRAVTLTP